jgi:hypothetical protein
MHERDVANIVAEASWLANFSRSYTVLYLVPLFISATT